MVFSNYSKNWYPDTLKGNENTNAACLDKIYPKWQEKDASELKIETVSLRKVLGIAYKFLSVEYDHNFKPKEFMFFDKHTSFFQNYNRFNSRKRNEIFTEDDIMYLQVGSIYFLTSNGLKRTSILKALGFDKVKATVEKLLVTENISTKIIKDTFTFINSKKERIKDFEYINDF